MIRKILVVFDDENPNPNHANDLLIWGMNFEEGEPEFLKTKEDELRLEEKIKEYCVGIGELPREYFGLLRLVLTGKREGLPIIPVMKFLGYAECQRRIWNALQTLETNRTKKRVAQND